MVRSREVSQARLTSMGVRVSAAPSCRTIPSPDYGWRLCRTPSTEAPAETLGWLAAAGFGHQALHEENIPRVRRMSWLLGTLAALMVAQTLAWLTALVVH